MTPAVETLIILRTERRIVTRLTLAAAFLWGLAVFAWAFLVINIPECGR